MGSRRIPASRQTAERIDELLKGQSAGDVRTKLIRLGVRKLVEEVLEAEVEDRLGRASTDAATGTPMATETATAGGGSRRT